MSVDQLMGEVRKDAVFYRRSGGGVTFSGGEPLQQASFLVECLRRCQLWGYHTTVETCGQTSWADLRAAAEHTDLFLYDVKHLDPERHRQYTGRDNRRILGNLVRLLDMGARVVVRVPIVPSCNDEADNVRALAIFAAEHHPIRRIELLPYHRLGLHKYAAVGAPPPSPLEEPRSDLLESMCRYVADVSGVECKVAPSFR